MPPKNHPNRKPQRLRDFDYMTDGAYFVTICTQNREQRFGTIKNDVMMLNAYGKIVAACWLDLPNHYPNCKLDAWVVMPNHFHGIIWIDNTVFHARADVGNGFVRNGLKPFPIHAQILSKEHGLSEMVRALKTFSSRQINELPNYQHALFRWQKSFHDHIIRSEDELNRIREYIRNNPSNWETDENNLISGRA